MTVFDLAVSSHWAMERDAVQNLVAIANRENEVTPEALEAYQAAAADRGERLRMRDDIAILDVSGPLFKRANLFVRVSGATSYEIAARDLQVALDDPSCTGIILNVDSPGGDVSGCDELAASIFEARKVKPITAYVSGMAASGAYWIAAAAERVVVSDAAQLGSIGVVFGMTDRSKANEKRGVEHIEFVSSQSPAKRPDRDTEEGRSQIQKRVDDLADVFISAVAKYRGVTPETVIQEFGAGGVEIGANAVALGMADEVGQFEATLAALSKRGKNRRSPRSTGDFFMSDTNPGAAENENQVDVAKIEAAAAEKAKTEAQARIKAILASDEGKSLPTLASHYAYDTDVTADDAIAAMKAAKEDVATAPEGTGGSAQTYDQRKEESGALGLGQPDTRDARSEATKVSWGKVLDRANAGQGPHAV